MIFCFDTNAFINPWHKWYPIDLFPDFWDDLDAMGRAGTIVATEEVLKELEKIEDDLLAWAKERPHMFLPISEELQEIVREILKTHTLLINARKGRSMADPFVIAQAKISEATVVTEEVPAPGSRTPHIPDVCSDYGVECINVLEFMRRNTMRFRRQR